MSHPNIEISIESLAKVRRALDKEYRKSIPLSEWLKQPTLFGYPIVEPNKIKDPGEIKFGDFSEYIRKVEP